MPADLDAARCRLVDLLLARHYRGRAWRRFQSALMFDGYVEWDGLSSIHLRGAVELETCACLIEAGRGGQAEPSSGHP